MTAVREQQNSPAWDHCTDLFMEMSLNDDPAVYPAKLHFIPVDAVNLAESVIEHLDEGYTSIVVREDAGRCTITPEPQSRLRRRIDRSRGRIRVRVELCRAEGRSLTWRSATSREAFARELVPIASS